MNHEDPLIVVSHFDNRCRCLQLSYLGSHIPTIKGKKENMALAGFPLDLGHSSSKLLDDLEGVTCPICLEIYEKPMTIACGHR